MRLAHLDHLREDGVPSLRLFELRIREHAAVPANVPDAARGGVFEPVTGAFYDVEFAIDRKSVV